MRKHLNWIARVVVWIIDAEKRNDPDDGPEYTREDAARDDARTRDYAETVNTF